MPNILISNKCNRACPYCFAMEAMPREDSSDETDNGFMSLPDISVVLDYFRHNNIKKFSIIGGEPTLHPHFREIVETFLNEGSEVFLFTNGLMKESTSDFLGSLTKEMLNVLVNVNPQETYTKTEWRTLHRTLSRLEQKASLGYNIYSLDFDFIFLSTLIEQHNLKNNIRLGLSQPIVNGHNMFLLPKDYSSVASRIVEQAEIFDRNDISIGMDCGFVLCMFTAEQLGRLKLYGAGVDFICKPVLDIGVDLNVWPCFPLVKWDVAKMMDFSNVSDLIKHFEDKQLLYKKSGIYKNCLDCRFLLRRQCSGGCVAHIINSYTWSMCNSERLS
jgi:radical SAM protein with 4Fe4S-binding SPASM domain